MIFEKRARAFTPVRARVQNRIDSGFKWTTAVCAAVPLILLGTILIELTRNSWLSIREFGLGFVTSQAWNPVIQKFGAAGSVFGTLYSTVIAMVIAVPLSLAVALFLTELAPPLARNIIGGGIELLAAIPSIIYGMWGLFVFAPFMAEEVQPHLAKIGGPLFSGPPMGIGMGTAGIILALMILPFISAVSRDVFAMVPPELRESAHAMGATTWEVTRKVTLRYGLRGIVGAGFIGLGRALGETMAVTFVIGNSHHISPSLFQAGNTIASTLANEFTEAYEPIYLSSLVELGLILYFITLLVQVAAQAWLRRVARSTGEAI
jgi:phosphate transport system permease protein